MNAHKKHLRFNVKNQIPGSIFFKDPKYNYILLLYMHSGCTYVKKEDCTKHFFHVVLNLEARKLRSSTP